MMRLTKKSMMLLIASVLLLTMAVGGTLAYFLDATEEVIYTLQAGYLATQLQQSLDGDAHSVRVENLGNVDVYVRVAILGNWVDENNVIVAPWTAEIAVNEVQGWQQGEDGFYYYTKPLLGQKNVQTPNLLAASVAQSGGPAGAHLEIAVLHQAIQAECRNAAGLYPAEDAWHVTIKEEWAEDGCTYVLEP